MVAISTTAPKRTHKRPSSPSFHRLRFLSVIGGFLNGQTFEFVDGLNCLIGARGTGKTTALEFIRYALDMLPSRDEDPLERRRIEALVQENLDGGRIQVGIETKDGLVYIVIRTIKRRRQLVFVTHNPNIPVLADAEQVFVLDSNGAQARLVNQGSVDGCKQEIVTLLEGGEEAFKRRRERYSY